MCLLVLLVMLRLLIGTRLHLLIVGLLSITELLCLSQCLFGMILVTLCYMVLVWRVLRAEPMLSCWPNLLFLFVSYNFLFFFLPWVGCVGLGVFGLIEFSHSLSILRCRLKLL